MPRLHLSLYAPRLATLVAVAAFAIVALLSQNAHAQTGATFAYQTTEPGWNLLGFYPTNGADLASAVFAWPAGATAYSTPTTGTLGAGYWAYYTDSDTYPLNFSSQASISVTIPARQCALVGNPSRQGSARVTGSSRTYVYSTVLGAYIQENLIGIGRGAWACNDQATPASVTIADVGDVVSPSWPDCCAPKAISNGGLAKLVVHNDSPYPLIAAGRMIDANGGLAQSSGTSTILFTGVNPACSACPEYATGQHASCSASATTESFNLSPGTYTLHLQSEGMDVPDLQASAIVLQADTSYDACWFVDQDRPQKNY